MAGKVDPPDTPEPTSIKGDRGAAIVDQLMAELAEPKGRWEAIGKKVYCWGWSDVSPPDEETLVTVCKNETNAEDMAKAHNSLFETDHGWRSPCEPGGVKPLVPLGTFPDVPDTGPMTGLALRSPDDTLADMGIDSLMKLTIACGIIANSYLEIALSQTSAGEGELATKAENEADTWALRQVAVRGEIANRIDRVRE